MEQQQEVVLSPLADVMICFNFYTSVLPMIV